MARSTYRHWRGTETGWLEDIDCLEVSYSGSESLSKSSNNGLWSSDEGGSGVGDDLVLLGDRVGSKGESVGDKLEVGGRGEWLVGNDWSAVGGVEASVGEDSSSDVVGGSLVLKPDGEDWLIDQVLVDGVDEWWDDMVDGEGGEGKSKDSLSGVLETSES